MQQVRWPAFIKYHNDDELHFLVSEASGQQLLVADALQKDDALIDSDGSRFVVSTDGELRLENHLSLAEVLTLARQHASVCGECCVSKMSAPDIASAVALIEHIN